MSRRPRVRIFSILCSPTRNARHGALYHGHCVAEKDWGGEFVSEFVSEYESGRIQIKKSQYAREEAPILES